MYNIAIGNIVLTKEEIELIGWGLLLLYKDTISTDKQTTEKQIFSILKKIDPNTKYHLRD